MPIPRNDLFPGPHKLLYSAMLALVWAVVVILAVLFAFLTRSQGQELDAPLPPFSVMPSCLPNGCATVTNPIGTISTRRILWNPQPDITTYELALSMPLLLASRGWETVFDGFPPEVKRHWREEKQ